MRTFIKEISNNMDFIVVITAFSLISLLSNSVQNSITLNKGKGWDGVTYYDVAEQLQEGNLPLGEAPFVYRIGTPFLVSLLFNSNNLLFGFKFINILANLIVITLLVFWFRIYIEEWKIRSFLVVLFITQWHGPVRFIYYYPVYVDSWLFVFLLAGLISIYKISIKPRLSNLIFLGIIVFIGTLFREVVIIIPIALLYALNPIKLNLPLISRSGTDNSQGRKIRTPNSFLVPLILAILSFGITRLLGSQTNNFSFLLTSSYWVVHKPVITYFHAYFIAFGPAIMVLLIFNWKKAGKFLKNHQFMLVYVLGFGFLAWIGGSDTERILFWSMPVIYLLVGISIEKNIEVFSKILFLTLIVCQLISQRLFWTIPDYPNEFVSPYPFLTFIGNKFQFLDLYSFHGDKSIQLISFLQYVLLSIILLIWLKYRARKLSK